MRNYTYYVYFKVYGTNCPDFDYIEVHAGCEANAIILAQAERIKAGLHKDIERIEQVD